MVGGPRSGMSTDKVPVCGPQGQTKDHSTRTRVEGRALSWILGRNMLTNLRAYAFPDVGEGDAGFDEGGRSLDGIGITHAQPSCEDRQTERLFRCYIVKRAGHRVHGAGGRPKGPGKSNGLPGRCTLKLQLGVPKNLTLGEAQSGELQEYTSGAVARLCGAANYWLWFRGMHIGQPQYYATRDACACKVSTAWV